MKNEYQEMRAWANNTDHEENRKKILRDVNSAYHGKNTHMQLWFRFLRGIGNYDNPANAVKNGLRPLDRTTMDTLHACRVCGTPHKDTYRLQIVNKPGEEGVIYVGHVCARTRVSYYGLNSGVLASVDRKSAEAKAGRVQEELEQLVSEDQVPFAFVDSQPAAKDRKYLGAQLIWVLQQKRVPKKVLEAATCLHDNYSIPDRNELRLVLEYIARARKIPASAFENVAKDIELMEKEKLAPNGLAGQLRSAHELTGAKAEQILTQTSENYRQYRIRKNTEFLKQYEPEGKSLATILEEIIPAVGHDKKLWRDDLLAQEYRFNKVLSPDDYRLVSKCLKRWAFGSTQHLQGADRLRLRNIALRIEPIDDFGKAVDGLIAIGRKLQYAKDHTFSEEQEQLKRIREEISSLPNAQKYLHIKKTVSALAQQINDPCRLLQSKSMTVEAFDRQYDRTLGTLVDKVDRSYALNSSIWARNHPQVEGIKDRVKYGIITADDVNVLQVLERCVNKYSSIDKLHLKNEIKGLQEAVKSPLVVSIPFANDKQLFANANCFDSLVKQTFYQWTLVGDGSNRRDYAVKIAADDWFTLRAKLYQNNLKEEQVLEMKAQLKGVPEEQLMSGRQMKYICPLKVKETCESRKAP